MTGDWKLHGWPVWARATMAAGVALFLVAVPAALAFHQALAHQRDVAAREGLHLLHLERQFLERELRGMRADLAYLAQQWLPGEVLAGEPDARAALEREFVGFARAKPRYAQIRLLDRSGRELVRVNRLGDVLERVEAGRLQEKSSRYYFQQAIGLPLGSMFVSSLDLNVERGEIQRPPRPVLRLAAPVRGRRASDRGLLVLNYAGGALLDELRSLAGESGASTALLNEAGEYLLAPEPGREWGWLLGHASSFRSDFPEVWQRIRHAEHVATWWRGERFTAEWVPLDDASAGGTNSVALVSRMPAPVVLAPTARWAAGTLAVVVVGLFWGLAYVWARNSEARRNQEQRIAESEGRLRRLSSQLLETQEVERRSLSRVLHDELGQTVTAIALELKHAGRHSDSPEVRTALERAAAETDAVLTSMHELATRIRPSVLDDLGLVDALESDVTEFERRTGIDVHLQVDVRRRDHRGPPAESVYRIAQEALSNVATHADTDRVRVVLREADGELRLEVEDEGRGFDPTVLTTTRRLGILGMRERVELQGGEFTLDAEPGRGTRIAIRLPARSDEEA